MWHEQRSFTYTVLRDLGMGRGILEPKILDEIQVNRCKIWEQLPVSLLVTQIKPDFVSVLVHSFGRHQHPSYCSTQINNKGVCECCLLYHGWGTIWLPWRRILWHYGTNGSRNGEFWPAKPHSGISISQVQPYFVGGFCCTACLDQETFAFFVACVRVCLSRWHTHTKRCIQYHRWIDLIASREAKHSVVSFPLNCSSSFLSLSSWFLPKKQFRSTDTSLRIFTTQNKC